ncbi:unnamed protein product [Chrysodeixis includens]|uniref:p23 protein n=1 Tax=Chrysodeixis includens TaxID=689277 RepID=E5LLK3_CHRIL|nr:P23 protein [Chrysodeixis includens]CAD0197430.1 unnamed protein product [Chrysodeixis includens]
MKTTYVVRLAALAAVLLASGKVDAGNAHYVERFERFSPEQSIGIIMCLANLVFTNNISVLSIMACVSGLSEPQPFAWGEGNYINFKIVNGESVSESGMIMNAELTWGKWQKDGKDIDTVNRTEFDSKGKRAEFSAVGRTGVPSGAEGFFEIFEDDKVIAKVIFDVPFMGDNKLKIKQLDKGFLCDDSGFDAGGSLTIEIVCHKLGAAVP